LIATISVETISFKYELFKFMFGVVLGDTAENGRAPNTARGGGVTHSINPASF
jgi:hypothetical protein